MPTYSQRVQLLEIAAGAFYQKFGSFGTDPGEFHYFLDAAADPSGNVYVLDDARVTAYNAAGAYTHRWSVTGGKSLTFFSGRVIVLTMSGATSGAVRAYQPDGAPINAYGVVGYPFAQIRAGNGGVWLRYNLGVEKRSLAGALLGAIRPTPSDRQRLFGTDYALVIAIYVAPNDQVWWLIHETDTMMPRPILATVDYSVGAYFQVGRALPGLGSTLWPSSRPGFASNNTLMVYNRQLAYSPRLVQYDRRNFALAVPTYLGQPYGSLGAATTFAPRGTAGGELAYDPPGYAGWLVQQPLIAQPCGLSNGRLLLLDGTYLEPAGGQLSTVIDRARGLQHAAYEANGNIYHAVRSLISDTWSAPVLIAAGTLPAIRLQRDGVLRVAYQTAGGGAVLQQTSADRGATWS
jgi:hypothetical protein